MIEITAKQVRSAVQEFVNEMKREYKRGFYDKETNRETLIERMDEDCDNIWGDLVKTGSLVQYDVDDMVETAFASATIIKVAQDDAWVEDDSGLWEGCKYGVCAIIAYYSLRNLLYNALKDAGVDTNNDCPFAKVGWRVKK